MELNPVRAGLASDAGMYPWSSACAHLSGTDNGVVQTAPLCSEIDDWESFLCLEGKVVVLSHLHCCQRTGRPCGDTAFISHVESLCGRELHCKKPGPKGKRDKLRDRYIVARTERNVRYPKIHAGNGTAGQQVRDFPPPASFSGVSWR